MASRKQLNKYFPKNFDPKLLVKRGRGKDKLIVVRNMLPMSLRCNVCANYLYIGTKFNMRMEICNEQTYLGIKVFRFYFKCTYCYNDICFKTDPKNHDYIVEDGGTRNYEALKDAQQASKLMRKMRKQQKQGNSMKFLQTKTYDSKRQMELMQALDDIKNLNKRHALIDPEDLLNNMFIQEEQSQKFTQQEQRQIDQTFDKLRKKKLQQLSNEPGDKQLQKIDQEPFKNDEQKPVQVSQNNNIKIQTKIEAIEQKGTNKQQFNPRLHAMMKGNLFNNLLQKPKTKTSTYQSKLPKKNIIKKVIVPAQSQKQKQQNTNKQ